MRPLALVGLALLVALAGCPALADGDRETVTPAPVPTTEPPSPPGVSDGRVDVAELVSVHVQTIAVRNYTLVVERRVSRGNQTLSTFTRTRRVAAGGERYTDQYNRSVSASTVSYSTASVEYWTDSDGYAARRHDEAGNVYLWWSSLGEPVDDVDRSRQLEQTLSTVPVSVADRNETAVVPSGRQPGPVSGFPSPPFVTGQRNGTLTARVTHDGVVTDLRYAYDARIDNESVRVSYDIRVVAVGSTTVVRPDWVDRAQNQTTG